MTTHTVLTIATTDDTTTEPDVIAAAEVNSVHEVYPEALVPAVDADPVWVNPTGAVAVPAEVVSLILNTAAEGLNGIGLLAPDADPAIVAEALHAISILMANHTADGMAETPC